MAGTSFYNEWRKLDRPPPPDRGGSGQTERERHHGCGGYLHRRQGRSPDFDRLHSRTNDYLVFACAFDLLMVGGEDLGRLPLAKRKTALRRLLKAECGGIQYVEHTEGYADKMFEAVCKLGLEGMVSKRASSFYRSGPSKMWIKVKNPKAPAATRILDETFGSEAISPDRAI
jgi:ATP-dependent DNA ligase